MNYIIFSEIPVKRYADLKSYYQISDRHSIIIVDLCKSALPDLSLWAFK